MKMEFNGDEVMAVMRKHVVAEFGILDGAITGVGWEAEKDANGKWVLRVVVGVKTLHGGPYREPG
jgi:hypothetical protein